MSRFIKSVGYAWRGIKNCLASEPNFKIHISSGVLVLIAGFIFKISIHEWLAVLLCIGFVLSMEMLNTAIEKLCDVVYKEFHPGIRVTKDIAAGAVLVSAIIAAVCAAIIFIPKIISLFQSYL